MELRARSPKDDNGIQCINCGDFLGEYYFFKEMPDGEYNIENRTPDVTNRQKTINFENPESFKEVSNEFPHDMFAC